MIAPGLVANLSAALGENGLIVRGGFIFGEGERGPPAASGSPARSILLVGQAGAAPWRHFLRWRKRQAVDLANPLDVWARLTIGAVAEKFGARAVSPSDKPYLQFQQWAMRAEGLKPSPLGILMHPEYGLWHAYRGALLFDVELSLRAPDKVNHLCDLCDGKPCLKACPVEAYSDVGFAYDRCLSHVRADHGEPCRSGGCMDRNACPYGAAYRYPPQVQAFHMSAFAAL
jgi:hypothetical protein